MEKKGFHREGPANLDLCIGPLHSRCLYGLIATCRIPNKLRKIQQEAFLKCASLTDVQVPPTLLYIGRRALGCTQLRRLFHRDGKRPWRGTYSHANAFLKCTNLDTPKWVRWLPRNPQDEDQWADDSFAVLTLGYTVQQLTTLLLPCFSAGARALALLRSETQTSKLPTEAIRQSTSEKASTPRT